METEINYKEIFLRVIKKLVAIGLIKNVQEILFTDKVKKKHKYYFQAETNHKEGYLVYITFYIKPDTADGMKIQSTSRRCEVILGESFDMKLLQSKLKEIVSTWAYGQKNEMVFYKKFLLSLLQKYPTIFINVLQATEQEDMVQGFDFIIWFPARNDSEIVEVKFNLKSSDKFLEKHKRVYPTVSTFIFREDNLKDINNLTIRFINFLLAAQHATAHF